MTESYDSVVAAHYAAFRPPLHRLILERLIPTGERFRTGLDVGCGTGYSAVALAAFCDQVTGIDPSAAMLGEARPHANVTYRRGSGAGLGTLVTGTVDVVTFAGSLVYAKSDSLRRALARVCEPGTAILVYDFDVLLDPVASALGLGGPSDTFDYDHALDLSDWSEFATEVNGRDRIGLDVSAEDLGHVLLAESTRYAALAARLPAGDLFGALVDLVEHGPTLPELRADIYFTRHRVESAVGEVLSGMSLGPSGGR
jgi:SAM-dependent methyltransferase